MGSGHHHHHDHEHSHDHGHGHHGHSHAPANFNRAFAIGVTLNIAFVAIEATYGFLADSLALLADAGHNLGDVLGLLLAWGASWLTTTRPSSQFTYGLKSSTILAALANAVVLLVAVGGIMWEAISRFQNPEAVHAPTVIAVAAIGIFINGATAMMFMSGRKDDLNIRGAFMHMLADALISFGVVISGLVMLSKPAWLWLDPTVSLVVGAIIIWGTWGLLKDSVLLALHGVPGGIDRGDVETFLLSQKGVSKIHDLHIWGMSTTQIALTAHLIMPEGQPGDHFLHHLAMDLKAKFKISHVTIQIEKDNDPSHACVLATHDC